VDLSKVAVESAWRRGQSIRLVPKRFHAHPKLLDYLARLPERKPQIDPLLAAQEAAPTSRAFTTTIQNFSGQGFSGVHPPDTSAAVGVNYVIQAINGSAATTYTIYNKANGALAAGPIAFGSLFSDPSNLCATSGGGDPIVLFDELANRWLISEFTSPFAGNFFCVYISKTSDPITGGWWSYRFEAQSFPDYPKYGVWDDAYYVGTNESAAPRVYAMDRSNMLTGSAATMQTKNVTPSLAGFGFQMTIPATVDGATGAPGGSPGIFVRHRDDEVHNAGSNNETEDYLDLYEFSVDFANPSNTTLTGPVSLAIAEFDSDLCGLSSFQCVEQPSPSAPSLDPLREVVMWRLQYRNTGAYEKLVGSQATDVNGADRIGVRWWELRRSGGAWGLEQEGTYAPSGDSHSRWMSSASSDTSGNIAVGYSVGSSTLSAGIRYSGRLSTDPAGTLTQSETTIQSGSGSQNFERWGDYSAMTVDPSDGCSFWYTNEYVVANGTWATKVASFKFDACGSPGFTLSGSNLVQSICSPSPLTDIPLTVGSVSGFTDPVTLSFVDLFSGFSGAFSTNPVTPSGTSTASVSIVNSFGVLGTQNFLIRATASGVPDQEVAVDLSVFGLVPFTPTLSLPADGATTLSEQPLLSWTLDVATAENFLLELDDDPGFGSIDYSANTGTSTVHHVATPLNPATTYSWRVNASNACGNAASPSAVRTFTTPASACRNPALAIPDAGVAAQDSLVIASSATIENLEPSLKITHTYVGDLSVTLTHVDTGTSVLVVDRPGVPALGTFGCSRDDIDVILSDFGTGSVEDQCNVTSPAISDIRTPNNPLSIFDGEDTAGTWQISVQDNVAADLGTLDEWCLLVPEPGSATMLCSGILLLWMERRMRGRRSRSMR